MAGAAVRYPRIIVLVVSVCLMVACFYYGYSGPGIVCLVVCCCIVGASCFAPDSVWAIQEDRRNENKRILLRSFTACLRAAGVVVDDEETAAECRAVYPPCFAVYTSAYGITEKDIIDICEKSLNVFGACRFDVSRSVIDRGIIEYDITFYDYDEADALAKIEVPYSAIEGIEPTYKNIPIGLFEDGGIASISLDNRNALICGLPRSGKSVCLAVLIVGLCRCDNERIVIISPKILDYIAFQDRAELYSEPTEILAALKSVNEEVERRKAYCVKNRLKKISQFTDGLEHIAIIIDEYAVIKASKIEDEKKTRKIGEEIEREILKIVSQAAFAGVQCVITSQRLSSQVISTDLRDICAGNLVSFANGSKTTDEMIFGDYAEYAKASQIPVKNQGVGYLMKEGEMPLPKMFKGAITDYQTERKIAGENLWKIKKNIYTR